MKIYQPFTLSACDAPVTWIADWRLRGNSLLYYYSYVFCLRRIVDYCLRVRACRGDAKDLVYDGEMDER